MKEFGSDFHRLECREGKSIADFFPYNNLYALGRHALLEIVREVNPARLFVPSYYCRESLECLKSLDVPIIFYPSSPLECPNVSVSKLKVNESDAVMVFNYFGLWGNQTTPDLPCTVIEDHSHDLISSWALNSKADWCFASLRKTLPIAEGGILWSPLCKSLPAIPSDSELHRENSKQRSEAMQLKADYLYNKLPEKTTFLHLFRKSETQFDILPPSPIYWEDKAFVDHFDIVNWYSLKRENWDFLHNFLKDLINISFIPSPIRNKEGNSTPFSLILLFHNSKDRDFFKNILIKNSIYPAVLWNLPETTNTEAIDFSSRMLSLHCDGRYSEKNIRELGVHISALLSL